VGPLLVSLWPRPRDLGLCKRSSIQTSQAPGTKHGKYQLFPFSQIQDVANKIIREAKITPWDAGEFQPPLQEFIEVNVDKIQWPSETGRALVPGCGPVSHP
jgi:hypothetical protein